MSRRPTAFATADARRAWDHLIVGAGSAGIVTAARLAARDAGDVLLLEAGEDQPDPRPRTHPLADAGRLVLSGHNWDHLANLRHSDRYARLLAGERPDPNAGPAPARALWERFPYQLGKVVGGGSAVNGAIALRGLPRDFAAWAAAGNPDWSWEKVLPFYRAVEHDADFPAHPDHGDTGPLPVHRTPRDRVHVLDDAFRAACRAEGVPELDDLNGGREHGVGTIPGNTVDGERVDAATAFLDRDHPALHLRTGVRVTRVLFEGTRAVGVEVDHGGRLVAVRARTVTLAAGAVGTPAVLQRSGIGPAGLLRALGITPVLDLPGVGRDLVDHPSVVIWSKPADGVCTPGLPWRQVAARMSGGYDEDTDVQIGLLNNVESHTIPGFSDRLGWPLVVGISVMLMRPRSRGRVYLDSADPHAAPVVELGLGTDPEDVERLCHGVRRAWRFLRTPAMAERLTHTQFWTDRMVANDGVLRSGVRHIMNPGWHAAGSCRMGPADDPHAVTDQDGRVHGTEQLRVVDASLFPTIPSAPTNLTTLMLAEKLARTAKE
ncbi:GMC family oxidoreductase (plasmid) [Streptomyces sp. BI20]|uniref:GMC family oxidoreductase n=1 Tax=Streptomyces sp. BI20 TaxID=3403460 RepID=UPI003C75D21D